MVCIEAVVVVEAVVGVEESVKQLIYVTHPHNTGCHQPHIALMCGLWLQSDALQTSEVLQCVCVLPVHECINVQLTTCTLNFYLFHMIAIYRIATNF